MGSVWLKRAVGFLLLGAAAAGVLWFAWPHPLAVDLATVARGPMEVTVEDEGKTRVRDVYTVSAPIAGKVLRSPRRVGDQVAADETVVAVMQATAPGFLDLRSRGELQAALAAAQAAVEFAEHEARRLEAALGFARRELERAQGLARRDVIAARTLDQAKVDVATNEHALASAKAQLAVRRGERATIAARLTGPTSDAALAEPAWAIQLRAPISGRVLALRQESEAVVQAGAPLIEIGDPRDLEVVADLLSTEAVHIEAGAHVRIDGWGGPPIRGRVVRVDPAGFTKVSALGVEEQRVRTVIDLADPPETWSSLGHEFRVIVHVSLWHADDVLKAPVAALFRKAGGWAVFVETDGRAQTRAIVIGRRNQREAEVLDGLSAGERVVLHPSDRVTDGAAIARRRGSADRAPDGMGP